MPSIACTNWQIKIKTIDIIFKNRYQIVFEDLDGIDDGREDPDNDKGVYPNNGDA